MTTSARGASMCVFAVFCYCTAGAGADVCALGSISGRTTQACVPFCLCAFHFALGRPWVSSIWTPPRLLQPKICTAPPGLRPESKSTNPTSKRSRIFRGWSSSFAVDTSRTTSLGRVASIEVLAVSRLHGCGTTSKSPLFARLKAVRAATGGDDPRCTAHPAVSVVDYAPASAGEHQPLALHFPSFSHHFLCLFSLFFLVLPFHIRKSGTSFR
jgi:hypothetical protein